MAVFTFDDGPDFYELVSRKFEDADNWTHLIKTDGNHVPRLEKRFERITFL